MDDARCFSKFRFGDVMTHAVALGMLLQPEQVEVWDTLPYGHNSNDIVDYPPARWWSECGAGEAVGRNMSFLSGASHAKITTTKHRSWSYVLHRLFRSILRSTLN